jgi:hypothetical protein
MVPFHEIRRWLHDPCERIELLTVCCFIGIAICLPIGFLLKLLLDCLILAVQACLYCALLLLLGLYVRMLSTAAQDLIHVFLELLRKVLRLVNSWILVPISDNLLRIWEYIDAKYLGKKNTSLHIWS